MVRICMKWEIKVGREFFVFVFRWEGKMEFAFILLEGGVVSWERF